MLIKMKPFFMGRKILAIIFILTGTVFSQGNYIDAPFGGGGGYTPAWYIPNMDAVNERVKAFGLSELSTSGFYTSGGAGVIYLGFVPGLRIGGMGYGGSTSESSSVNGINKEAIYSLSGGGFTIEYSLPFIRNVGLSIGAVIGGGSLQIEVYQNRNNYNWNEIWENDPPLPGSNDDISNQITNDFWFFSPTLNIDIPVYRFASLRIGGGYQITFGDDWTIYNDKTLNNVPSDISGNSFFIQSGIFIGFFSF